MRRLIVWKLVSSPPSQRWLTYGMPAAEATSRTMSRACFLVPTNSTTPPRWARVPANSRACSSSDGGLEQIDDVDAAALAMDEAAHLGVPAARLVTEVNAGLQQFRDAYLCHGVSLACLVGCCTRVRTAGRGLAGRHRRRPVTTSRATILPRTGRGSDSRGVRIAKVLRPAWRPAALQPPVRAAASRTSNRSPVIGCSSARRVACRNWRSRPSAPAVPYSGSPATGLPIACRCTRIWWVRPVSSRRRSSDARERAIEREVGAGLARKIAADRHARAHSGVAPDRRLDRAAARAAGGPRPARGIRARSAARRAPVAAAGGPPRSGRRRAGQRCRGPGGARCRRAPDRLPRRRRRAAARACPRGARARGAPRGRAGLSTTSRWSSW